MSKPRSLSKSLAALAIASAFLPLGPAFGQVVIGRRINISTSAPTTPASVVTISAPTPITGPVLLLNDEGFLAGELLDGPGIRWRSAHFNEPFDFVTNAINAIHWPSPKDPVKPKGDYCFELAGGDVLYGSLIELGDTEAVIEVPLLGKLKVERSALRRIDRWNDSADLIYSGPIGLTGWKETAAKKGWREEAGQPISTEDGATLRGGVNLPPKAIVEFEVSWKNTPDFSLALGVGPDDKDDSKAFRFEVWEGQLVAMRENDSQTDITSVQSVPAGPGRAHVQAYLDQETGRMTVVSSSGKPLGDLKVSDSKDKPLANIALTNNHGDIRLERLRIRKWNGESPREAKLDQSRIHLVDGSIVYGRVQKLDAETKEFVVKEESKETRVPADKVASLFLSPPSDAAARSVRIVGRDGSRLSGDLTKVEGGEVWLKVPGIADSPHLAVKELLSMVVTKPQKKDEAADIPDGPNGTLDLDGVHLKGRLAEIKGAAKEACIAWRPDASTNASSLKPGVAGKIVYKEPKPVVVQPRPMVRVRPQAPAGFVQGVFGGLADAQGQNNGPATGRRALHLRTGDVIPSEIIKIDEVGVTFKTTLSDSTFVAHDKIKAVELAPEPPATIRINKAKREKLLTLPRLQKDSPPTQMIRSKTGDFLRGRVLELNEKTLKVEVRLETKEIPRDRVSRIIWLHPDEIEDPKAKPKDTAAANKPATTRIQAIRSDGIRLTFTPESFADSTLSGKSDVLGACRVKLEEVDGFLIGDAIEKAAGSLTYGPWKLHNAVEPIVAQDDEGGGGRSAGTESAMVGKPAPDFTLDLLGDGKETFQLSKNKGKVVILDFWATWCGPCLQAMPQVEAVAVEFKDKGVQLIAVNLEEDAKTIKSMMERHKLKMTVALDRDGATAMKYQANAIPQTVIIDKNGNVARLFIGGGPKLQEQLKAAVEAVLSGKPPEKAAEKPAENGGDPKVIKD